MDNSQFITNTKHLKAVIQRTDQPASVTVDNTIVGKIDKGLIIYLGIGEEDAEEDLIWLSKKIVQMRIFSDTEGKMNQSVQDIGGGLLVISQFTLFASTKKGNRPSYLRSAPPEQAQALYNNFIAYVQKTYDLQIGTGIFGADMQVSYVNNGPVTIIIDSKNKQ